MSKRSPMPQSRRHVMIYDEDWEILLAAFGPGSQNRMGPGVAVRHIVRMWRLRVEAKLGMGRKGRVEGVEGVTIGEENGETIPGKVLELPTSGSREEG